MKKRVLILGCGTIAATDINMALRYNDQYEIYGSSDKKNHGEFVYKNYIDDIPNIKDKNFIKILNQKIDQYSFKFIIPTHEDLALFLQEHNKEIKATIVCSDYDTALLCRYKTKTYAKLRQYDFIPKVYEKENVKEFPVFIKKDNDQGARHAYKINNKEELDLYTKQDNMVICEYLPGEEVTVDCFTNKDGKLLFCNPRMADRMLAGIDVHARRIKSNEIIKIGQIINQEIKFRGFWFFQVKKDKIGKYKLLEISTRLPGAFSLSRCLDVNLPLLALKDFDNQEIQISYNDIEIEADKQFFGKYKMNIDYDNVYVDIDTCIEKTEEINTLLMMFLYQLVNKKKKIIAISKNKKNSLMTLEQKKISFSLFNEIIEYSNEIKVKEKSIFISNNEKLRKDFRDKKNGYSFSGNIVECLLDWRA